MKKIKFFLLGGLLTLLGIFNFSSAGYEYYKDIVFSKCSQYSCYTSLDFLDSTGTFKAVVTDSRGRNLQYLNLTCTNNYTYRVNGSNDYVFSYNEGGACRLTFINSTFFGDSSLSISAVLYKDVPVFDFGGVSALTPATTGIQDTVFQLIPLIIFINIGLLLCSICFVAIRWLVNWLSVKIKSVFSSKR